MLGNAVRICGSAPIMAELMAAAPWLPPNTNKEGGAPAALGGIEKNSGLTGTPVTFAFAKYFAVSVKCTAAPFTFRATTLLARPGTRFGSKARVGIPRRCAAIIAGPDA